MIALVHQHAKGEGQESLREGAHPVLTHVCPLGGGYAAGLELLYGLDRRRVPALSSAITSFACSVIAGRFRSAGASSGPAMRDSSRGNCKHSPLTPFALEVNDLVRGSQQCSAASPQLCALVEVAAGESIGVGGS